MLAYLVVPRKGLLSLGGLCVDRLLPYKSSIFHNQQYRVNLAHFLYQLVCFQALNPYVVHPYCG